MEIVDDIDGDPDAIGQVNGYITRSDNSAFTTWDANGIPVAGGAALRESDMVVINRFDDRTTFIPVPHITVRIYLNQEGGGATDLFVIDSEATFPVGVADPNAGEFYLDANWVRTENIVDAQGFTGPTCGTGTTQNRQTGECDCNANLDRVDATMCEPQSTGGNPPQTGGGNTRTSGGESDNEFPVVGGVVAAVLIFGLSQAGTAGEFAFSPDFDYSVNESGYFINTGGRMDFYKDKWHLYYSAGQTNRDGDFGDFRYESGGEYGGDFWNAKFSETISGETANYNFALSANFGNEIWNVKPTYRIHSRFDENESEIESETRNSLNLESELRWNRWKINPSAGFSWQNENDFADNAKFRINAVHRF